MNEDSNSVPRVTVIVAVYNGAKTLQRCLDSINGQTYQNRELIIMDGASTDGTLKILEENTHRIAYWESKKDRGIAHAWNKAMQYATGDWVLFLGADDYLWHSDSLSNMVTGLIECEDKIKVVYGSVMGVNADGKALALLSSKWDREKFVFYGIYFSHQGIFHHKDIFSCCGTFDENFRYGPDYEFLLRHLVNHDAVYFPEVIVSAMQYGGVSNRPENALIALMDLRKARRKHGINRDALYYYRALAGAIVKKIIWLFWGKGKQTK